MAQISRVCAYLGTRILAITQPFLASWAENFYGNSGDYYLSMRNPNYDAYFSFFDFRPLLTGTWAWSPRAPLLVWASKPNQKFGPLGGPFGPITISKSCFRNFQA